MRRRHTVLVVDDEEFVRESLVELLRSEGYGTLTASNKKEALSAIAREGVSAVFTDLSMPEESGLALLAEARADGFDGPVVLLTGVGTVGDAVAAMKSGAFDFIEKPVAPDHFLHVVARALEHLELVREVRYLRHSVRDLRGPTEMVGSSPALAKVRALIAQVAPSDATVLITGESGTGKELVAAEIHRQSRRKDRNLVRVNCAAISENLFESEFFGHRRGAFTGAVSDRQGRFAEAEGGTLVLDEIGTLRPEMQAKLLRVLETREYQVVGESRTRVADVRIVAVTNEDLDGCVARGAFRADLFYRLNVFPIVVPPLRARREDVPALAAYFLERAQSGDVPLRDAAPAPALDGDALSVLASYSWPGNVRELRNVMERAAILGGRTALGPDLLRSILGAAPRLEAPDDAGDIHLRRRLDALERRLVIEALARVRGKKGEAAALLGIDPRNLSYYVKKHALSEAEADGVPGDGHR